MKENSRQVYDSEQIAKDADKLAAFAAGLKSNL